MFGLQSFGIWSAYLLCILSTAACVLYGILNWNKEGNENNEQIKKAIKLEEEESKIKDNL